MEGEGQIVVKKVKKHAHGHHGGAWKVAYADFVTAMMAFFMVMWILGMDDGTKALIAGYFRDPAGFMKEERKSMELEPFGKTHVEKLSGMSGEKNAEMKKEAEGFLDTGQQVEAQLQANVSNLADHVEVEVTDEGLVINLFEEQSQTFFESGSASVRPLARQLLTEIAPTLAQLDRPAVIDGHTDAKPMAGTLGNLGLSADRAEAVAAVLIQGGLPQSSVIAVRGMADGRLAVPSDPYHFRNRRVTILLPYSFVADQILGLPPTDLPDDAEAMSRAFGVPEIKIAPDPIRLGQSELSEEDERAREAANLHPVLRH